MVQYSLERFIDGVEAFCLGSYDHRWANSSVLLPGTFILIFVRVSFSVFFC